MTPVRWRTLFGLDGKLAVVTDSGRNASPDIAALLAEAGAHVILADRDSEAVRAPVDTIKAAGGHATGILADVESETGVVALFEEIQTRFGSPDILVNCAAMNGNAPLTEMSLQLWDEVQSVNLRSVFICLREGLKHMVSAGKGGRIVNLSTIGALHPVLNGNGAYGAARAGTAALTRSAALDYAAHGIRINTVMPGAIQGKVRFHASNLAAFQAGKRPAGPGADMERRAPFGFGKGEDIAAAVLYLVGPCGAYITGQQIVVDGGFLVT